MRLPELIASALREDLAELGGEGVRVPALAILATEETAVTAREDHRLRAEPLGHRVRATARHLTFRLGAGAEDDPRRGDPKSAEVGLVVGAGDDVLAEHHIGPGAVVLGGHPERRRIRRGMLADVVGELPAVTHDRDE